MDQIQQYQRSGYRDYMYNDEIGKPGGVRGVPVAVDALCTAIGKLIIACHRKQLGLTLKPPDGSEDVDVLAIDHPAEGSIGAYRWIERY